MTSSPSPLALALLSLLGAGCWGWGARPETVEAPTPPDSLAAVRALMPIPEVVTYVEEHEARGERWTFEVEERWYPKPLDDGRVVYELSTMRHHAETDQNTFARQLVVFDHDGLAHLAAPAPEAAHGSPHVKFDPPMIVIPANATPGVTWADVHTKGDKRLTRNCRLEATPRCPGGVVSHCEVSSTYRMTIRDTFCPGVGMVDEVTETRDPQRDELVIARTTTRAWSRKLAKGAVRAQ